MAGKDPQIHTVFDPFSRKTRRTIFESQGSQSSIARMEATGGDQNGKCGLATRDAAANNDYVLKHTLSIAVVHTVVLWNRFLALS